MQERSLTGTNWVSVLRETWSVVLACWYAERGPGGAAMGSEVVVVRSWLIVVEVSG